MPTANPADLFDDTTPVRSSRTRRRVAIVLVVVVGSVAVIGVRATSASPGPTYRTATVAYQDVGQTLHGVGVVEPVIQSAVAFPVAGTVGEVDVAVGDVVNAGQVLAVLDTTSLQATVEDRQAALDKANLTLQQAENGQSSGATSSSAASGSGALAGSGASGSSGSSGIADATAPTGSGSGGQGATGASSAPSSEDIAADRKAVAAAEAHLAAAQQALDQATILSSIDGTVVGVTMGVGDQVSAASSTARIVVMGGGGYEVTAQVKVTDLPRVKTGQPVAVTPDGTDATIGGTVLAIGLSPSSSSSSSSNPTYPVTIKLDGDQSALRNGTTVSVAIETGAPSRTLAVPTSAVAANGDRHTVKVLDAGKTSEVEVKVGAIGTTYTAITSGLDAGQVVVLADLSQPLPGSATTSSSQTRGQTGQDRFPFQGGSGTGGGTFGPSSGGAPPGAPPA